MDGWRWFARRFRGVAGLGLVLSGYTQMSPGDSLLDLEYQYHRVGNRKATVEELREMQQREETHINQLQAEIDRLQLDERALVTERESRDAALPLLAKEIEILKHQIDVHRADLEGALATRSLLEHERDLITAEIGKLRTEVTALREVLRHSDEQLAPDKARLNELLE